VADRDRLRIFRVSSQEVVQTWEVGGGENGFSPYDVSFLDNGNKLTWTYRDGRYLYDFEKNTKWYWTPRTMDHIWGSMGCSFLNQKNLAVTHDGNLTVRF
jgi:hypothetical protein